MLDTVNTALAALQIPYEVKEPFEGIELFLKDEQLFLEKLPNADDFSLSAQFCRYYELDDIKRAFEIFLNFHIHGILTGGFFLPQTAGMNLFFCTSAFP